MKKLTYILTIALIITLAVSVYSENIETDLENNLIRLHIIANSDSEADQSVKLKVRDAVISEVDCSKLTPDEAAQQAASAARRVLAENNFSYGAYGEFTEMEFPLRRYNDITLPRGRYKAVRIVLGNGNGHNWWCVLYPPVCMEDARGNSESAREQLKERLKDETYDVITNNGEIKIKFKSAEILKKIIQQL
ncbi:MAG: stage II sporulation protein R [bacterium]|nr:stage II sporulation protein R [bacterium]